MVNWCIVFVVDLVDIVLIKVKIVINFMLGF